MDGLDEKFEEVVQGVLQSDLTLFKDTVSVVVTEALLKKVLAINEVGYILCQWFPNVFCYGTL